MANESFSGKYTGWTPVGSVSTVLVLLLLLLVANTIWDDDVPPNNSRRDCVRVHAAETEASGNVLETNSVVVELVVVVAWL